MADITHQYQQLVSEKLRQTVSGQVVRKAEVLCFPSFHAETFLRVAETSDGTTFHQSTFSSSFWRWYLDCRANDFEVPTQFQETIAVPFEQADAFWKLMTSLNPASVRPKKVLGLDGMSIIAAYQDWAAESEFESWSPDPTSPEGEYLGLIYRLGWEVLRNETSIERLEGLHGYLRLGLSARIIPGEVKCLRLFGSLTSSDERALRKVFESLPKEEPLLVDMTNFDGMGTLLFPAFVDFSSGHNQLAWAVSKDARRYIEAMKMQEPVLFDTVAEATRWLRERRQS